jgi:hypothetical protein
MWLRFLILLVLLAAPAAAQTPDTTRRAPSTTVSGVVHDSIARIPLAGATVQLVASNRLANFVRTAVSDSLGRFTLRDVPAGRFMLGFFHPSLDSLGVDAPLREVDVDGNRRVRVDLATPSPARLRAAICGPLPPDSSGVLVGVVRDARDGAPAAGVAVTGEWLELSLRRDGFVQRTPRLVATTGENGWFAMCNVPSAGTMTVIASRGADSTDRIEVQVSAEGFARRDLYLGPARTIVTGDTTQPADSLAPPRRRVHVGDALLSGVVVAADGGRPVQDARVSITDGPQTRANERGEWTLLNAPIGTRMLEVRAVGYYPERRAVNVVAAAPPVRVALSTLKAVLDTVRITATRLADRRRSGFEDRRRTGIGRYMTPDDIARRLPIVASDLFRNFPGVNVDSGIRMRGGGWGECTPALYIDGIHVPSMGGELAAEDIDVWVRPEEIAGVEVYFDIVPPQFNPGLTGCGSIVIWRK